MALIQLERSKQTFVMIYSFSIIFFRFDRSIQNRIEYNDIINAEKKLLIIVINNIKAKREYFERSICVQLFRIEFFL